MRKAYLILLIFFMFVGCTHIPTEKKSVMDLTSEAGSSFYPFTSISGGGTGALDKLDGSSISLGDVAFVTLNANATYDISVQWNKWD